MYVYVSPPPHFILSSPVNSKETTRTRTVTATKTRTAAKANASLKLYFPLAFIFVCAPWSPLYFS